MPRILLDNILPEGARGRAARAVWSVAFLLFPAVLLAGFVLLLRTEPGPPVPVSIDARQAVEIARSFAVGRGVPAQTWDGSVGYSLDSSLLAFVNANPRRNRLWQTAPPLKAVVTLKQPVGDESAKIYLSVAGKVLDFEFKGLPAGTASSDAESLRIAEKQLPHGLSFGAPALTRNGPNRSYTFTSASIPDLEVKADVRLEGNRVASLRVHSDQDPAAEKGGIELENALSIAGFLFVCFIAMFSVFRYASRSMQQEVSHRRSLIVGLLCGCFCMLLAVNAAINSEAGTVPFVAILLIFGVVGSLGGALLAAAYGSGEGDAREAYPGKLTSLDALLTGRVFSRNVGVSVLFGIMCASWLTLALAALDTPFRQAFPRGSASMATPFMHLTWLMPFVLFPLLALTLTAAALLQPLAFLSRYMAKARRWHVPALLLCAFLASMARSSSGNSSMQFAILSAVLALSLVIPFLLCDLLSSLVCITVIFAAVNLASNVATFPSSLANPLTHLLVALSVVIAAIASIRYGVTLTDEQVRPLYARHIAERKSLEAEVSAAREAQLRLLPQSVPELPGVDISAVCVPAEIVGGDFYDFFPLGDGRLGIFIAEGNNRGLAAALTIALAKGYLMHRVQKMRDPVEILKHLEAALASIFGPTPDATPTTAGFAFAAFDAVTGHVQYARTGVFPKVVIAGASGSRCIERPAALEGRREPIVAGSAIVHPGDFVVMFTDGIGRRLTGGRAVDPEAAVSALVAQETYEIKDIEDIEDIEDVSARFLALPRNDSEADDLTVILIRMTGASAALRIVA